MIPIFAHQHKDVVVEAITGSGKTLAFVVPILEILLKRHKAEKFKKHHVGALIISPTRELAQQTFDVINTFLATSITCLKSILFVGGNSITKDIKDFLSNGGNIVVGTAGRLEDLLTRQHMTTSFKSYFKNLVENTKFRKVYYSASFLIVYFKISKGGSNSRRGRQITRLGFQG